jgi:hypothetical protein
MMKSQANSPIYIQKMKIIADHATLSKYDIPEKFPDELLDEEWAIKIHSQSLVNLDSRGGLTPQELIGNIKRLSIIEIINYSKIEALKELEKIIKKDINDSRE